MNIRKKILREKNNQNSIFRNKKFIIVLSAVLGIAATIILYRIVDIKEVINTLRHTTLILILLYILIQIIMLYIVTWRWKVVLDSQNVKHVKFSRLVKYVLVGRGIGFLTPSGKLGSEPVRAGLLSSKEDIKFEKAFSSVIIDRSIDVTTAVVFFVVGMFLMLLFFVASPIFSDIMVTLSIILLLFIFIFNYRMLKGKKVFQHVFRFLKLNKLRKLKKFEQKLESVETLVIKFYHKDTNYFYQTLWISLLSWLLMFVEYKIAGNMVGQNLTPVQSFLIFSFVGIAYMMPIPMSLGALEASQISAFSIIGVGAATGLALSFLIRLKDFIMSMIGIVILGVYGINIKQTVQDTKYLDRDVEKMKKDKLPEPKNRKK
jgi:uncharacterized protein (TIRG00374 family)